jgi:hypothetical protein
VVLHINRGSNILHTPTPLLDEKHLGDLHAHRPINNQTVHLINIDHEQISVDLSKGLPMTT